MHVVTVLFDVKQDALPDFLIEVRKNARLSLALEEHCHRFDVCTELESKQVFLYELYKDATAFDEHKKIRHYQDFVTATSPWLVDKTVRLYYLDTDG